MDDDWSLTDEQYAWFMVRRNDIEQAYMTDDMDYLRDLADTDEYLRVFGNMSFDEAYDRWEEVRP